LYLSAAGEFFELCPARILAAAELALRRAAQRRGKTITDAIRCLRRVLSQAHWAFPDLWNAFAGSRPTALAVLARWPHLDALARAGVSSITEVVAAHTRGVANVEQRAQQIRATARAWAEFWDRHLDLDARRWETSELLADLAAADTRVDRATEMTRHYWNSSGGGARGTGRSCPRRRRAADRRRRRPADHHRGRTPKGPRPPGAPDHD
jgi:hypothetical protein